MTYTALRFAHFFFMALWIATTVHGLLESRVLARMVCEDAGVRDAHGKRSAILGITAELGTVGTGIALVKTLGGWEVVPWPIHVGASVAVVMMLIGGLGVGRTYRHISRLQEQGAPAPAIEEKARRLTGWHALKLCLWSGVLFLMVFRHLI